MEIKGELSQGLGIIGTLAKEVAEVSIIDNNSVNKTNSHKDFTKSIRAFKPDVIGFHLLAYNMFATGQLVAMIKENFPHIALIGGGLHSYSKPEEILELGIHVVAMEEADLTILPLLRALEGGIGSESDFHIDTSMADELEKIQGLLFSHPQKQEVVNTGRPEFIRNLDDLPFVDHNLFNLDDFIRHPGDAHNVTNTLITQRGCPFDCSFCQGKDATSYSTFRTCSPAYRFNYIRYIWEQHKHNLVVFFDSNFAMKQGETIEFARLMKESELHGKVKFWCDTNVATRIDPDTLTALWEAGCTSMAVGVERMTRYSLDKIGKNKDNKIFTDNLDLLSQSPISITINTTVGYPFDTVEIIEQEREQFEELQKRFQNIMTYVIIPVPGTRLFEDTPFKKWYMDKGYAGWKPPFYHTAFNFNGNAWDANYFQLDDATMKAIRDMREGMHANMIEKIDSNLVTGLFTIVSMLGKFSYRLYVVSPVLEKIVLFPVKSVYNLLWKFMVNRYFAK